MNDHAEALYARAYLDFLHGERPEPTADEFRVGLYFTKCIARAFKAIDDRKAKLFNAETAGHSSASQVAPQAGPGVAI